MSYVRRCLLTPRGKQARRQGLRHGADALYDADNTDGGGKLEKTTPFAS